MTMSAKAKHLVEMHGMAPKVLLTEVCKAHTDTNLQPTLKQIINTLPQHILWKDSKGVFLGCNSAFAKQFGFTTEDKVIGMTDYDFDWSLKLRDKYIKDDREIINTGQAKLNYLEEQRQPDGTVKIVQVTKRPIYENKKIVGVLCVYSDKVEYNKSSVLPSASQLKQNILSNKTIDLSTREREVVAYMAKGLTARETAEILKISVRTVESYIESIKSKLGVSKKIELFKLSLEYGLL